MSHSRRFDPAKLAKLDSPERRAPRVRAMRLVEFALGTHVEQLKAVGCRLSVARVSSAAVISGTEPNGVQSRFGFFCRSALGGTDVATVDRAPDPRVADRGEEVGDHAERDERCADPRRAEAVQGTYRELPDARDLPEKDAEAGDREAERHQRDAGADPGEHGPLVGLVEAEYFLRGLRRIRHRGLVGTAARGSCARGVPREFMNVG